MNTASPAEEVLQDLPGCVKVLSADGVLLYINTRGLTLDGG